MSPRLEEEVWDCFRALSTALSGAQQGAFTFHDTTESQIRNPVSRRWIVERCMFFPRRQASINYEEMSAGLILAHPHVHPRSVS